MRREFVAVVLLLLASPAMLACSKEGADRSTATKSGTGVAVGQLAPDVTLLLQDGKETKLSDHRGSQVLLFFYPKDDSPG